MPVNQESIRRYGETPYSIVRAGKRNSMPRGHDYELMWAKDTEELYIQTPSGKKKLAKGIGPNDSLGGDEKVKAQASDPSSGYLIDKVSKSITVNTSANKLELVNDLDTVSERRCYCVDASNQKGWHFPAIRVQNNGTLVGVRPILNFIPGTNIQITTSDQSAQDRVNVTISASSIDEKVRASPSDPNPGFLNEKVTGSIAMNATGTQIQLVGDSSAPGSHMFYGTSSTGVKAWRPPVVTVKNNGVTIGTRHNLNFIPGSNVSLNISDAGESQNQVNIMIDASGGTSVDEKVKASASDPTPGFLSQKITGSIVLHNSGNFIQLDGDSTNPGAHLFYGTNATGVKGWHEPVVRVLLEGALASTRPRLNFASSTSIVPIVSDSPGTNSAIVAHSIALAPSSSLEINPMQPHGIRLIGDGSRAANRVYSTDGNNNPRWHYVPMRENETVVLNGTVDVTTTENIVDWSGSPTPFRLILSETGLYLIAFYFETTMRVSNPTSSSITAQILLRIYKREGTTDTLLANIRANHITIQPNTNPNASFFNSSTYLLPFSCTYTGSTQDIRTTFPNVNGTIILVKAQYTTSGSPTISTMQIFSTTSLSRYRIT